MKGLCYSRNLVFTPNAIKGQRLWKCFKASTPWAINLLVSLYSEFQFQYHQVRRLFRKAKMKVLINGQKNCRHTLLISLRRTVNKKFIRSLFDSSVNYSDNEDLTHTAKTAKKFSSLFANIYVRLHNLRAILRVYNTLSN